MTNDLTLRQGRDVAERSDDTRVGFSRGDNLVPADGGGERQLSPRSQALADWGARQTCERVLRKSFGPSYEKIISAIAKMLELQFGRELAEDITEARLWDGRRLADIPEVTHGLAELIGLAVQGLSQGGGDTSSPLAEIEQIRQIMKSDMGRYRREGHDVRLGTLLAMLDNNTEEE